MSAKERINQISGNMRAFLTDFRRKSEKKIIGVVHPVVPQEIIYAAKLHPIRLLPFIDQPITVAHAHMHINLCSNARATWDQVLKGEHPYLDGVVFPESCESVTYFARGWMRHRPDDFTTTTAVPFKKTNNAIDFFAKEIDRLAKTIGELTGKQISKDSLSQAISVFNRNRELLREIYELRKGESPPISGVEALNTVMVSFIMDKEENNRLLEQLLTELRNREQRPKPSARLLVSGPCIYDVRILETVESSGAMVVADDINTGSRSFWHTVDTSEEPLLALAKAYSRVPCPFSTSAEDRLNYISKMITEYRADGVVFAIEKGCESEKMDFPFLQNEIKGKLGVPVTFVETEYLSDMAPLRTRVDGFVESLTK